MNIKIEKRETSKEEVNLITVKNSVGFEVAFTDMGAAVYYIAYPDKKGNIGRVTTCPKDFDTFVNGGGFYGKAVGRVAARLKNAIAIVNGKEYKVDVNESVNCLHGGKTTFGYRRYNFEIKSNEKKTDVIFTIKSQAGESGFPGNVQTKIIYTISETKKELLIKFQGKVDEPTLLNLTSHIYFNLNGGEDAILDQELWVRAHKVSHLDQGLIIEGWDEVPSYFDYTVPTKLGKNIRNPILLEHRSHGMDHIFLFDGINKTAPSAILFDPKTKRKMTLYTDYPAMICYCDNYPTKKENLAGVIDQENYGITFETIIPTDDPKAITFSPERPYSYFAKYKFN